MEFIRKAVDWVYVLNFGEVIAQGPFERSRKQGGNNRLFGRRRMNGNREAMLEIENLKVAYNGITALRSVS